MVVCLRSHLRSFDPATAQFTESPTSTTNILPQKLAATSSTEPQIPNHDTDQDTGGVISVGDLLDSDLSPPFESPNGIPLPIDEASVKLGEKVLGPEPVVDDESEFDDTLRSRVLKDPFHVFNMFYISATHSLRAHFTRELRDAIFVPDQEDKQRINAWGETQNPPQKYETLRNSSPRWIREHCRHIIPAPKKLRSLVSRVFRTYGPLVDPQSKKPLFTHENWKTAKHVLELIQNGYLSDPPGIPLYTMVGIDKKAAGLPVYRCARGTNSTEGGVHKHIRARLPKCGASIRHVVACLSDFVLHHNQRVSSSCLDL
ncbi:hypothetical protein M413DRAFT_87201 [Hebeloma cylindrosporum]|uniref:Uncharacterized protein n=1 Tax=Hebeloma cylindrosporum TaxID=76867 RepID=A0A0C3CXE8_HEBCY|nr:hypothetical protein M413DRAFT_87201 [Hebeloma cylindrosporum h7]